MLYAPSGRLRLKLPSGAVFVNAPSSSAVTVTFATGEADWLSYTTPRTPVFRIRESCTALAVSRRPQTNRSSWPGTPRPTTDCCRFWYTRSALRENPDAGCINATVDDTCGLDFETPLSKADAHPGIVLR